MKAVIYHKEVRGKTEHEPYIHMIEDKDFGAKMERLAKAYARWDKARDRAIAKMEKVGYNEFYDNDGFDAQDKAIDILAKRYNIAFGTDFDGETFVCSKELERAYFAALNHGAI